MRILILLAIFSIYSCKKLEQDVDIKLPPFESQLVVEAYVIPGDTPLKVCISETQDYFGTIALPFINDATVIISYQNQSDTLILNPIPDLKNGKYFNYYSAKKINYEPGLQFTLIVKDKKGRTATSTTKWLNIIPIDSVKFNFNDSNAIALAYFKDPGNTKDFYRFRVTSLNRKQRNNIDFFSNDDLINGQNTVLGTAPFIRKGDTVEVDLYHISPEFFEFLTTVDGAESTNGNPFAQPTTITSNIIGGTGIFEALSFSRIIQIAK